jgi:hypothetical protein
MWNLSFIVLQIMEEQTFINGFFALQVDLFQLIQLYGVPQ